DPNKLAPPLIESNLSATTFALEALQAANHSDPEPYYRAELFLLTCQNEDGGFHFIYDDPVRNKAGGPNEDRSKFYSYGSTTADGVRALSISEMVRMRIEDESFAPKRIARGNGTTWGDAWRWLVKHFHSDRHPGEYIQAHERNRDA